MIFNVSVETIQSILGASTTLSGILLALLGTFIVLRQTGRLAGMGPIGLSHYMKGLIVGLILVVLSIVTTVLALLYLIGNSQLYYSVLVMFVMTLFGVLVSAIIGVIWGR